jgi:hypothetical protein
MTYYAHPFSYRITGDKQILDAYSSIYSLYNQTGIQKWIKNTPAAITGVLIVNFF